MSELARSNHGMSFEQFRSLLRDGEARTVLGVDLTDQQARVVADDESLARAHYDHWGLTFDPLRSGRSTTAMSPVPTAMTQVAAPGWYPNEYGQQQWWDGRAWGAVAPPVVVVRPMKDVGVAYLFLVLLGGFAAHRFYLGRIGSAIAILVLWWGGWTLAGLLIGIPMVLAAGIWLFVDLFLLPGMTREYNAALGARSPGYAPRY